MMGLNAIPVVGWLIAAALCFCAAVPVYFLWNWLAPIYMYQLPAVYLTVPFWDTVGLVWLIASLKGIFLPNLKASVTTKGTK